MVPVYLKDGLTVYDFDDAAPFRALLHDRPGYKPKGGAPIDVAMSVRERTDSRDAVSAGIVKLRYIARSSVSHVEEVV